MNVAKIGTMSWRCDLTTSTWIPIRNPFRCPSFLYCWACREVSVGLVILGLVACRAPVAWTNHVSLPNLTLMTETLSHGRRALNVLSSLGACDVPDQPCAHHDSSRTWHAVSGCRSRSSAMRMSSLQEEDDGRLRCRLRATECDAPCHRTSDASAPRPASLPAVLQR